MEGLQLCQGYGHENKYSPQDRKQDQLQQVPDTERWGYWKVHQSGCWHYQKWWTYVCLYMYVCLNTHICILFTSIKTSILTKLIPSWELYLLKRKSSYETEDLNSSWSLSFANKPYEFGKVNTLSQYSFLKFIHSFIKNVCSYYVPGMY